MQKGIVHCIIGLYQKDERKGVILMKVIIVKDQNEGGKEALKLYENEIKNGAKVFGLATGSTPITTYEDIVVSDLDFSDCVSVNLDEYVGLTPDNDQSYHYFMNEHLFKYKKFKHSYVPDGTNMDAAAETARYDKIIEENPIDLQLLGLGRNGHIGFNEPGTPFDSTTHKIKLTQSTIDANKNNTKYPGQLMAAVGEVSKQISQQKQQNNGQDLATKQDIQAMLNKALAEHGIANETTNNQN